MLKIQAFFIAVYLFFAGFIYGDEPVKLEFSYDIPSEVYVYAPGDRVEINVTVKNVGRPFEQRIAFYDTEDICIYNSCDEEQNDIYTGDMSKTDALKFWIFKSRDKKTYNIVLCIPENAVAGTYNMTVRYKGIVEPVTFEKVFEIE